LAILAIALALGGCLQDARNADKNFDFNNVNDPTPTTTGSTGIVIAEVDTGQKIATIVNSSGISQVMTGWKLVYPGSADYPFPSAFTLNVGAYVRVHSDPGTDAPPTDLWTSGIVWSGTNTLTLNDGSTIVSSCRVGNPIC
jgi:hypothetical protein